MALNVVLAHRRMWLRSLTCVLLATIILGPGPSPSSAAPLATDNYGPACSSFPLPDPPPGGFRLWSNPATWGAAGVPGVGARAGQSALIGCGVSILLDVPNVRLDILDIQGHLKVLDDGKTNYQVFANAVLVQGQLTIGAATHPFAAHIAFTLTNTNGRTIQITRPPLSGHSTVASLGTKVFAVVGGRLRLYGMRAASPSWIRLTAVANKGALSIRVNADVSGLWPVGGLIAITSTDYNALQAEEMRITRIASGGGSSTIYFDKPLQYMHWGGRVATTIAGRTVDESAEVALLSRNILIQGSSADVPYSPAWNGNPAKWSGNRDYPGNDLYHMTGTWYQACQMACAAMFGTSRPQRCVGFTMRPSTRECWLKSAMNDARSVPSSLVAYKMDAVRAAPLPLPVPAYVAVERGLDFPAYTLGTFAGVSIRDCEALCYAAVSVLSAPCVGFQMEPDGSTCSLKQSVSISFASTRAGVQAYTLRSILEGGHFIVFHTVAPGGQQIDGVEFNNMGQQGTLGRYPVHFHFCKDDRQSVINKCAVHHSHQRCYVVHGTNYLTFTNNVGYNTKGHCFMTEEGYEHRNTFTGNLAFMQDGVVFKIPTTSTGTLQSDNEPTSFWMSNPDNDLIDNVSGGATSKSFWYELMKEVRGDSATLPGASDIQPYTTPLGKFTGNVAHSSEVGFTLYPPGHGSNTTSSIVNFRAFKNNLGAFIHGLSGGTRLTISDSTFADNGEIGVDLLEGDGRASVINSFFVGETDNIGNPAETSCRKTGNSQVDCRPRVGCTVPPPISNARSQSFGNRFRTQAGIGVSMLETSGGFQFFTGTPNTISGCTFAGFRPSCGRSSGAIYLRSGRYKEWFNAGNTASKIIVANDGTPTFHIEPPTLAAQYVDERYGLYANNGPSALTYAFRDADGSITGSGGGYIIANNPAMAANYRTRPGGLCYTSPKVINGLICPGECYRTVLFTWRGSPQLPNRAPAIRLTRVSDGAILTLPSVVPDWASDRMTVYMNVLAGQVYRVAFLRGMPAQFSVGYHEGGPTCAVGIVFRFDAPGPGAILNTADVVNPWKKAEFSAILAPTCARSLPAPQTRPIATAGTWACQGTASVFDLALGPTMANSNDDFITLIRVGANAYPCNCNGRGLPAMPRSSLPLVNWAMLPPTNVRLTIARRTSIIFWWADGLPHSIVGGQPFFVNGPGVGGDIRTAPFSKTITFPWPGVFNLSCGVYQKRISAVITVT